jgi:transcriptional regulator with XRE-family HTH domain/predicted transcriptional regulator
MSANLSVRTILGIKLKRLREARHLTLEELAAKAGLSTSYLAEIQAGKKHPKAEKILALASALDTTYDELVSTRLEEEFGDLQNFLSSPGVRDFPFETFGVPPDELMRLLTRSPHEVGALIRALSDIASQYAIGVEHFLHAALRSYQELTGNYYEEIERAAEDLARELGVRPGRRVTADALREWARARIAPEVDERALAERPALAQFRAVFVPGPPPRLYLNPRLTESQRAFVLARECGYRLLGLKARSFTTPPDREDSFEQVLNDFKASYFAGAVLLPRDAVLADLRRFFRLPAWQGEALLGLLDKHDVTAETLMYRLSQLVPRHFGLPVHFLRFNDEPGSDLRLVKQLNLSQLTVPAGIGANEHYCRRWLSTRLLLEAAAWHRRHPKRARAPMVGAQLSRFPDGRAFFCVGLAVPMPLRPGVTTSLTLGFRADEKLYKVIRFARDRTIPQTTISGTCERCPLTEDECDDRVAPPVVHLQAVARAGRRQELEKLGGGGTRPAS